MPDKGKVMSQAYYEKQNRLYQLYQESFARKEMNVTEAKAALRIIGFSDSIVIKIVNEWTTQCGWYKPETDKAKNRRLKQQTSLEKYILYIRLGKKFYAALKSKYENKEISRAEVLLKLKDSKHSRILSESIIETWEAKKP